MKQQVVCEVCQGELFKQENIFICQHCGIKYSIEEVKIREELRLKEEEQQKIIAEEQQKIIAEEQRLIAEEKRLKEEELKLKEEKERLKEEKRLMEEKRFMEEQRLREVKKLKEEELKLIAEEQKLKEEKERLMEVQQKIIAEEQKLKKEKERLTGKLRVIAEAPQEEVPQEAPQEEVVEEAPQEELAEEAPKEEVVEEAPQEELAEEAPKEEVVEEAPKEEVPQEAPQEAVKEISKENETSIFGEPLKQKKKKGCFRYFIIIIFLLAIIAYFAKPYYIDYIDVFYDYIGAKTEKENDIAVVEADALQQNPVQDLGVSDSIEKSSNATVTKEVKEAQGELKITKKNEEPKKQTETEKRTEAEKQIDDDIAQAIAAVLKPEPKPEPEPAPKSNSEPKSKAKTKTSNKGNFYKTSFNCENTNHATTLAICTNEELAKLDVQMNKLYQPLRLILEEDQKEWRKKLNKCKVAVNCLDKMYRDRIKVLKEIQ